MRWLAFVGIPLVLLAIVFYVWLAIDAWDCAHLLIQIGCARYELSYYLFGLSISVIGVSLTAFAFRRGKASK